MSETKAVKGYKVFNPNWTCKDKQYACPGKFEEDVTPSACDKGMHFCKKAADCFNYYSFDPNNKAAEVIAYGDIVEENNKCCTNKLEIVREIPWAELLELVNTGKGCTGLSNSGDCSSGYHNSGDWNSGDWNSGGWNSGGRNSGDCNSGDCNSGDWNSGNWNSGDWNSGYRNSGDWNSGDWNSGNWNSGYRNSGDWNSGDCNSGDCNSGDWNSGNWNSGNCNSGDRNSGDWNKCDCSSGCFNTEIQKMYLFNKLSDWTYEDWLHSKARQILYGVPMNTLAYIQFSDMTKEEKAAHPQAETTGGYLKETDGSKRVQQWWNELSNDEKSIVKAIPNFDKAIFKEITGIDVDAG